MIKSYTSIGEIINRYWPNHIQVLVKLHTGIGQIIYRYWWNCIRVLAKSYPILVYLGRSNFFYPGNFFEIFIDLRNKMKTLSLNKIHSPSGGYPTDITRWNCQMKSYTLFHILNLKIQINHRGAYAYRIFRKKCDFSICCNPSLASRSLRQICKVVEVVQVCNLSYLLANFLLPMEAKYWRRSSWKILKILSKNTIFVEHSV